MKPGQLGRPTQGFFLYGESVAELSTEVPLLDVKVGSFISDFL